MVKNRVPVDPTLSIYEAMLKDGRYDNGIFDPAISYVGPRYCN